MSSKVIKNYLLSDVVDSTASATRAANPLIGWTVDADVPQYLYTSLSTLWMGASGVADYSTRILATQGESKTRIGFPGYIEVIPYPSESIYESDGMLDDAIGAERSMIKIFFQTERPVKTTDFERLKQAELRIRCLLDEKQRGLSKKSPNIPISGDSTIDNFTSASMFKCVWEKFDLAPDASEIVITYRCDYVRLFSKVLNLP